LYLELGAVDRAREVVYSLLEDHPSDHDSLSTLIAVEGRARKPLDALPKLDAAIEGAPEDATLYRLRGQFYLQFIRPDAAPHFPDRARGDLIEALRLNPDDSRAHALMGRLEEALGNDARALGNYDKALETNANNGDAYLRKSALEERMLRNTDAIQTYNSLFRIADRSGLSRDQLAIARNNMAWLLATQPGATSEDMDRALELAREAKETLTSNPAVADTLGYVMLKRGIPGAASSLFREAISGYAPDSAGRALARCHLAMSLEENGEVDKAVGEFEASLGEAREFPGREECESALLRLSEGAAAAAS
jgi:predicted Zn-dependent protease